VNLKTLMKLRWARDWPLFDVPPAVSARSEPCPRERRESKTRLPGKTGFGFIAILGAVVDGESRERPKRRREPAFGEAGGGLGQPRRVPGEVRNVSFPVSPRGYDRRSVDAYVIRINRLIAELEATRSPAAVVTRALEQAKEQTDGIIDRAREMAAEITGRAWNEAEKITARAKAEAADIVVNADTQADRAQAAADAHVARAAEEAKEILAESQKENAERLERSEKQRAELWEEAETWLRKLRADTEALWEERCALLDDVREMASRLEEAASAAAARFPSEELAEPGEGGALASEPAAATKQSGVAADDEPDGGSARGGDGPPGEKREAADAGPTGQLPTQ
jgi:DivIVA domain-containing protein